MTTIHWDGRCITALQKAEDGAFDLKRQSLAMHELGDWIHSLQSGHGAAPFDTPFADVLGLSQCTLQEMETLVWHIKTLQDGYDASDVKESLDEAILFLHTTITALHGRIREEVTQAIQGTLAGRDRPLKINLGAGPYPISGWVNVDLSSCDVPYNVAWGLPFEDRSADFIYSSYLLEHLNYHTEAPLFIREIHRVLRPGGVLRIAVPNIRPHMEAYVKDDEDFFAYVEQKWGFSFGGPPLEKVLNYAGSGYRPAVLEGHKFAYDDRVLKDLLASVPFSDIYPSAYDASPHDALRVDLDPLLNETYGGQKLSLIYECVRSAADF